MFVLTLLVNLMIAQTLATPGEPPQEMIEGLWKMAAHGDLLTKEGWKRAGASYTVPTPWTENKAVLVVSNDYALDHVSTNGNTANAVVTCQQLGQLDSALRYSPAPPSKYFKSGWGYDLVIVPSHTLVVSSDGKQEDRVNPKTTYWKISGSQGNPWTTVNTAIRYVLEKRAETSDPQIKKNADATLSQLLKLH